MAKPPKIFVSYCLKDREWLERLQVHFKALERNSAVDLWDDTEIRFGADWDAEITCNDGKLYLTDLNSMNFTLLNEERLHPLSSL